MNQQQRQQAFKDLAVDLEGVDLEVYQNFDKDPLEPILGEGDLDLPIAIFGRDPGRDEVQHQLPFIGAGGQLVRSQLYRHFYRMEMPDFAASIDVGRHFFWANTVPYKPIGNKAWSMKVKRQFRPLVADLLINGWNGEEVITLGREAFFWFGIDTPREHRLEMEAFWREEDRFTTVFEMELQSSDGKSSRILRLHPLPHPSPLNATWYKKFPDLLQNRLLHLF